MRHILLVAGLTGAWLLTGASAIAAGLPAGCVAQHSTLQTGRTLVSRDTASLKTDVATFKADRTQFKADRSARDRPGVTTDVAKLRTDVHQLLTDLKIRRRDRAAARTDFKTLRACVVSARTTPSTAGGSGGARPAA